MSRYSRTEPAAAIARDAAPSATAQAPTAKPPGEMAVKINSQPASEAQLRALGERQRKLQERRMRREIDRDNALKEIQSCQKTAQEFGITTLEGLVEHVEKLERLDAAAMEEFIRALNEEEALLDQIDRALSDLEQGQ